MKEIKIVHEDENIILVEKPAGLVTTKERKGEINTLEDFLIENRKNSLARNGIVHRLDKGSSGLVLIANNEKSLENLKSQFKNRQVVKRYICLVEGDTSLDGTVDAPIIRSKRFFGKFAVGVNGKRSLTEFRVLKKFSKGDRIYSLLEVNLKTGRTHQIRVHMSYLGWPLVGDKVYGGSISDIERPFLHAAFIQFSNPVSGKNMTFESKLPDDLNSLLEKYEEI